MNYTSWRLRKEQQLAGKPTERPRGIELHAKLAWHKERFRFRVDVLAVYLGYTWKSIHF